MGVRMGEGAYFQRGLISKEIWYTNFTDVFVALVAVTPLKLAQVCNP